MKFRKDELLMLGHENDCCCGHEHSQGKYKHKHNSNIDSHHVPGHLENCQCEACHPHVYYCDVCGESLANCTCKMPDADVPKKVYLLENLDCANCAAKMEHKIQELPGVRYASVSFTTKQLRLSATNQEALLPKIQEICQAIESAVVVIPRGNQRPNIYRNDLPENFKTRKPRGFFFLPMKLWEIVIGALLFLLLAFGPYRGGFLLYGLLAAYIILGYDILLSALKNLFKGRVLDENFLMLVATIGAFIIGQGEEAVGVMLFYRVGEYFEELAVAKSRNEIMTAVDMRPEVVNLLIGEEVKIISAVDANVGDILLVRVGDRIPLDGVVIDGESLIDLSPVTGEPVPVRKIYGDEIISGCVNTSGVLKMRVEKILQESMVTKILDAVENAAASKPRIDKFITSFARIYTPVVVAIAVLTAVIPGVITGDWEKWTYTALTFLVISCPCALVLSVPLAFFAGIGAGSKRGILFKGGVVLEALKNCSVVVMDKTGTVTQGNFILQKIMPTRGIAEDTLLQLSASVEVVSAHPIANSIVLAAKNKGIDLVRPTAAEEIAGEGIAAATTFGKILCGNKKLMERYGINISAYHSAGFGTEVLVALNGEYVGNLLIADTIKSDAASAITKLKEMGLSTVMLTGDATESAQAVAAEVGIDRVYAKLLPQDKYNVLNDLRAKYGGVMFVGDGINDAPVLAGADVGAAMGSGADAAIEAADVVFMNSEMESIPKAIEIAKTTNNIAWQNVVFALVIKVAIMVLGLGGFASMWMAVFADTGVAMLCVINSVRILYQADK